jgi:hypothetical protein
MEKFPRALTEKEKYLLFKVLPESKPGYKKYREKIEELVVIGQGRFSRDNMILGKAGKIPDLSFPSTPIFAIGTVICKETQIDIAIHEEIDNEIEFDITTNNAYKPDEDFTELSEWNYSEWVPGMDAPYDNSEVKEVAVIPDNLILTIAPKHKKIWLHNIKTGVNHLIPLSNFYNQLMMVRDIRNTEVALKPGLFFDNLTNYSDGDLVSALITYNKYIKRFDIDLSYFEKSDNKPSQKSKLSFLKRGKN